MPGSSHRISTGSPRPTRATRALRPVDSACRRAAGLPDESADLSLGLSGDGGLRAHRLGAILVGSRCPIAGRPRPTREELERVGVAREITGAFLPDPTAIPALWLMSGADVDEFVEPGPVNTWDRMAIEFTSYRASGVSVEPPVQNLRFLLRVQAESSREAPDFTRHPLYASMPQLHLAFLNLMELNRATARDLFGESSKRTPPTPSPDTAATRRAEG